jgi:hypothetical protein
MTAIQRPHANGPTAEWIVCGGRQRDVGDGGVDCPLTGAATALEACLACRHLAWAAGERDRRDPCELPELS